MLNLSGSWMRELQFRSVKEIPSRLAEFLRKCGGPVFSVYIIPHDRMTYRRQVHTNLMRPTGLDLHFQ